MLSALAWLLYLAAEPHVRRRWPQALVWAPVQILCRRGRLAFAVFYFTANVVWTFVGTREWGTWAAGQSFAALGIVAALAVWGFFRSLEGRPLLGHVLLED